MKVAARALLCGVTACAAAASLAAEMPEIVVDESAANWVVDRFAGNSTAGPQFFQGPARQAGGLGRPRAVVPMPDGRVYLAIEEGIAEVDPDGMLRLVVGGGGDLAEGPAHKVCGPRTLAYNPGGLAYNPGDKCLYLTGPNCIRRLVERPDGSRHVEVVCGTPGNAGYADGPAKAATFTAPSDLVIDSKGTIYVLDNVERLRRIQDGQVTTLNQSFRGGKLVDGPLAEARFALIGLGGGICAGENDDALYVADHWNFRVRKIDLEAMTVSTVAGMPKPKEWRREKQTALDKRYNRNSDGPALTHASFNSGCCYVCWDPMHKALWCGGPDESRFRWLTSDGWLRTVIGTTGKRYKWPKDALAVPAAQVFLGWNSVEAIDAEGRAYLVASSDPTGVWRAYNTKEVKP
jgi:hypothetical protein